MEKRSQKNARKFIIVELILLFFIVAFVLVNIKSDKLLKSNEEKYGTTLKTYKDNEEKIKDLESEISKVSEDLESYSDLDNKIKVEKEEYFKAIKELEDQILAGKSDKKIAYLTFDDGPYYNTYKVLDILDKYNVKATFFTTSINGETCYDNRNANCFELYKEYIKRGHTIANHTYTHAIRKGLYASPETFIEAVKKQEEHIKEQTSGYITNIVRFPGGVGSAGSKRDAIIALLKENGYGWVNWSAQDGDGGGLKTEEQAWKNFTKSIDSNIEVILFHDYNRITTTLLPKFIEYLESKGYIMLPLFYESNTINK